ncbi:MAG: hypothetical protein COA82_09425 [Alkaliphilus sp.]|nr:hypothetical protein [Alkaliphilus transvaalensis]PHS32311.1 MAG: hypothetical protein COA82_09425 [Alkaliphilus sp.]
MEEAGLDYRATKDLDIVLCIEALDKRFINQFWKFVSEGNYQIRKRATGEKCFYRFTNPQNRNFPTMLEILSKKADALGERNAGTIVPMIIEDEIVSLSAILLEQDYYNFILSLKVEIDDLVIADERCIIPLKARAWLDLTERKREGAEVRSTDIKKHKNDVYRMSQLLNAIPIKNVPNQISEDIQNFVNAINDEDMLLKQLGIENTSIKEISEQLIIVYCSN